MLHQLVKVVMDRPLGSRHPKHGFYYPVNCGYLENTVAGDGEEVDAYVIGEFEPLDEFLGYVVATIYREDDVEEKLVVCDKIGRYDKNQIKALVEFQERFFKSHVLTGESDDWDRNKETK